MTGFRKPFAWVKARLSIKASLLVIGLYLSFAAIMTGANVLAERSEQVQGAVAVADSMAAHASARLRNAGGLNPQAAEAAMDIIISENHRFAGGVRIIGGGGETRFARGEAAQSESPAEAALIRDAVASGQPQWMLEAGYAKAARSVETAGGGAVLVSYGLGEVRAAMWAVFWRGLAVTLIGLAIVAPLTMLAVDRAMRPMRKLIEASREAARGRLDIRVDTGSGDEWATLGESFNAMLDRLKGSLEHVRRLAYSDHLTGLPNKSAFSEHSRRVLLGAEDREGAMFLIDLDRFKRLNDTLGTKQGDRLIRAAGERMQKVLTEHEQRLEKSGAPLDAVLSRITGDEFALIAAGLADRNAIEAIARDMVRAIDAPFEIGGEHVVVSGSVGIARFPEDGGEPDVLMRNANLALDAAKQSGGAAHRFFAAEMTRAAVERMTLENELRRAVDKGEFIVYYQPKVAARSGALTGCEALIRWRTPEGEIRSPGRFIGVAEETGLIAEMGDFVLRESCRAAARWRDLGIICPVSVNVSAVQFERDDFHDKVVEALKAANLPPELLELEITESVAMTDPERASAQIEPLREMGVRFAIDDFGTGHSSLSHLTQMPFDTFKIDRSFIQGLGEDENARVIVQTILALARSLQLETVAEGAETAEQVAMLQGLGCAVIQGFFFARPMPEGELVAYAENAPKREAGGAQAIIRLNPTAS